MDNVRATGTGFASQPWGARSGLRIVQDPGSPFTDDTMMILLFVV